MGSFNLFDDHNANVRSYGQGPPQDNQRIYGQGPPQDNPRNYGQDNQRSYGQGPSQDNQSVYGHAPPQGNQHYGQRPPQDNQRTYGPAPPQDNQRTYGQAPPQDNQRTYGPAPPQDNQRAYGQAPPQDNQRTYGPAPPQDNERTYGQAPSQDNQRTYGHGPLQDNQSVYGQAPQGNQHYGQGPPQDNQSIFGFGPPQNNQSVSVYGHAPPQGNQQSVFVIGPNRPPQGVYGLEPPRENPRATASIGTLYSALDGYENDARHRKYMIAECEDTIENLTTALAQITESNKQLASEVEKLDIEAAAAETNYEMNLKEKQLIENEYHDLSKEMDEVTDQIGKKRARMLQMDAFHKEKLELIFKTEKAYMKEYMKNPKFAKMMENQKKTAELETQIQEKSKELQEITDELRAINNQFSEKWPAFVKKCVKIAEIHAEIKEKRKTQDQVRSKLESKRPRPSGFSSRRMQLTMAGSQDYNQQSRVCFREPFIKPKRSVTFQNMDRILNQSSQFREPNENARKYIKMLTLGSSGTALVSQLKSRLRGTVLVNPMPRNPDPPTTLQQQPSEAAITDAATKNAENENGSLSQQSRAIAYFPPSTTDIGGPSAIQSGDILNNSKPQSVEIDAPVQLDKASIGNRTGQLDDRHISNQPNQQVSSSVGMPPTMSFPQPQAQIGTPGSPLKRVSNPQQSFLQTSSPEPAPFNLFGGSFNMGGQSPAAPTAASGGGFDFFDGFFSNTPATQSTSGNNDFFSFF